MAKKHNDLNYKDRIKIETLRNEKRSVSYIAKEIGVCRQTIYNELRRGEYMHNCGYYDQKRYSADRAQAAYQQAQQAKGRNLKIGNDIAFAYYIEDLIVNYKYSPAAALAEARKAGYRTSICTTTLYSYIDAGLFLTLTIEHLTIKRFRKKHQRTVRRIAHPKLPSIEDRPKEINDRSELGHWEMDLIISGKGGRAALLVLVERLKKYQLIRKIPDKSTGAVLTELRKLRRKYKIKSITTDNGSEFLAYEEIKNMGIDVYYCHSYAAWEKGQVEKHNQMIRRWLPKGTNLDKVPKSKIQFIEQWMNNYPRKSLNWNTPAAA